MSENAFMDWVRKNNAAFSQSGDKINLNRGSVVDLFNAHAANQAKIDAYDQMEKALERLVDHDFEYLGKEVVNHSFTYDDIQFARSALSAARKARGE